MTLQKYYAQIESMFGKVRRARKNFLYFENSTRIVDLYRENGRAILGWGEGNAKTVFKNVFSRGVLGGFKTSSDFHLEKAICQILKSKRKILVYERIEDATEAAKILSFDSDFKNATDFLGKDFSSHSSSKEQKISRYIPWLNENTKAQVVIFSPPLAFRDDFFVVAFDEEIQKKLSSDCKNFLEKIPQKKMNAPFYEAASRAIYDLIQAQKKFCEKDFFRYDKFTKNFWLRRGPYLFPKIAKSDYDDFVIFCLRGNLAISPDFEIPSIVPFEIDEGVFKKFQKNILEKQL